MNKGFNYVKVVGENWIGFINLFYDDDIVAMVPPPLSEKIMETVKERIYETRT